MSTAIKNTAFPTAMELKLRRIRRRQISLAVVRALAIATSVLIAAMLVAMLTDWWFTIFNTTVRTTLTLTSLSLAAGALLITGIGPVIRALGWARAAQEADAEVPQLEERWTTVSHFAEPENQLESAMAQAMLQQVTSEAVALDRLVEPTRVIRTADLKNVLAIAGANLVLLFVFLSANWEQHSVLLRRFWAPNAAITATQLESITGDITIKRGESISIVTKLTGMDHTAATLSLESDFSDARELPLAINTDDSKTFTHLVEVDESFRYRVSAGDGQTAWHTVTAVDPPEISDVQLTVTAPEYAERPPYEKSLLPGRVKALQGSRLTLKMRSEADLERFTLQLARAGEMGEPNNESLTLTPEDDGWYCYETILEQDIELSPVLHSPFGLTNEDRRVCRIRVMRDQAPTARVISPTEEMSVSADDEIDIKYEAHDDLGVAKIELVVDKEFANGARELLTVQEVPFDKNQSAKHVSGSAKLDLSKLELEEGASISYAIRVTDNRMLKLDPTQPRQPGAESESTEGGSFRQATKSNDVAPQAKKSKNPGTGGDDESPAQAKNSPANEDSNSTTQKPNSGADAGASQGDTKDVDAQPKPEDKSEREAEVDDDRPKAADEPETKAALDVATKNLPEGPENGGDGQSASPADAVATTLPPRTVENAEAPKESSDENPSLAKGDSESPETPKEGTPKIPEEQTASLVADGPERKANSALDSIEQSDAGNSDSLTSAPPLDIGRNMRIEAQLGQNTESNRMRLMIADRMAAVAQAGESRRSITMRTREFLERIDRELEAAESLLATLNDEPDSDSLPIRTQRIDARLKQAVQIIADLRTSSKETRYEFVGLQMLDIERTHVSPARDRMFVLIRDPGSKPARNILEALHHTSSARELIAALTKQFEEVAREQELADSLAEIAKIYEVYVENTRGVLRAAQQNQNPLQRKMAVVEVDDAYLDRFTQVLEMEQELMIEFARILGEDPRLMGKYVDMIKRRSGNLRNRLTELRELQEAISYEVGGWLRVDEPQRPDVWIQVADQRLLAAREVSSAATQLQSRTLAQLPLNLEPTGGIGLQIVESAGEVALAARQSFIQVNKLRDESLENDAIKAELAGLAANLSSEINEFTALIQRLAFEEEDDGEVRAFTNRRLAESRALAEQAITWAQIVSNVRDEQFHGLAAADQQRLAVDTDRLRIDMSTIEEGLAGLFAPDDVPDEIKNIVRELLIVMESITFNQAAATFELINERISDAESQQTLADKGFARAEELFDKMRRTTVDILDELEAGNPDIAALEDPSLDEFLERLEREPNLQQLLGIPNRPNNLRVIRDWLLWEQEGGGGGSGEAEQAARNAMLRAQDIMARRSDEDPRDPTAAANDDDLTEAEMKQFAAAERTEEEMEQMLQAINDKLQDPSLGAEQAEKLKEKAEMLAQMLGESREGKLDRSKWRELVKSDVMRAMIEALAKGEPIPDSQWNRIISTLDTGLWQVRGRTPPEDYRRPIEQYQDLIRRLLNVESVNES